MKPTDSGPGVVGLFLVRASNIYQAATARAAQENARRHGLNLYTFFADDLAVQQSRDIVHFLHEHAKAGRKTCVIVMPVADIVSAGGNEPRPITLWTRRVAAAGSGLIVLNRDAEALTLDLAREFPSLPLGSVTADNKAIGRLQGQQYRALLPGGGRILYVVGHSFVSSARDRREGMLAEVVGAGFTIDEIDGHWGPAPAREAVSKWLARSGRWDLGVDMVGCQNDEMAMGAREALVHAAEEYDRPALAAIPITGGDGLPEGGQKWVDEKKLTATIVMPTMSGPAIDLLVEAWKTGRPMPIKTVVPVSSYPPLERLAPAAR